MNLINEAVRYLGMGYWNLPDEALAFRDALDRGNLYYRWGKEGGKRGDFYEALAGLSGIADEKLPTENMVLDKYNKLLDTLLEIMRLETTDAAYWFEFLCDNRARIELRDLSFADELKKKMSEFMDREENLQKNIEDIKSSFTHFQGFSDPLKEKRKTALADFEKEKGKVDRGIEAFYGRIREYVSPAAKQA